MEALNISFLYDIILHLIKPKSINSNAVNLIEKLLLELIFFTNYCHVNIANLKTVVEN